LATGSQDALDAEIANRTAADTTLTTNLAAEVINRTAADTTLTTNLAAEVTNRTAAVLAEKTRAEAAELVLTNDLAAEATTRSANDTVLQNNINTEASARATAVSTLAANVYTKAQTDQYFTDLLNAAPAALDTLGEIATALQNNTSLDAALTNAVSNEVTRATTAEAGLQNNIDALTGNKGITRSGSAFGLTDAVAHNAIVIVNGVISTVLATNSGLQIVANELLTKVDASSIEVDGTGALSVKALGITAAELATDSVVNAKIQNGAVSISKLNADVVGNGLQGGAGTALNIKLAANSGLVVDASGLRTATTTVTAERVVVRDATNGVPDGILTDFDLTQTPFLNSEEVFLNGILQEPGIGNDYTISGATITFSNAPFAGDRVRVKYIIG
jgi:hypothetical protein